MIIQNLPPLRTQALKFPEKTRYQTKHPSDRKSDSSVRGHRRSFVHRAGEFQLRLVWSSRSHAWWVLHFRACTRPKCDRPGIEDRIDFSTIFRDRKNPAKSRWSSSRFFSQLRTLQLGLQLGTSL